MLLEKLLLALLRFDLPNLVRALSKTELLSRMITVYSPVNLLLKQPEPYLLTELRLIFLMLYVQHRNYHMRLER